MSQISREKIIGKGAPSLFIEVYHRFAARQRSRGSSAPMHQQLYDHGTPANYRRTRITADRPINKQESLYHIRSPCGIRILRSYDGSCPLWKRITPSAVRCMLTVEPQEIYLMSREHTQPLQLSSVQIHQLSRPPQRGRTAGQLPPARKLHPPRMSCCSGG